MTPAPDPLIVSAVLDDATTARLDALRRAHFPPERLVVGAHLTLFHALPGRHLEAVLGDLRAAAAATGPLQGSVARLRSLGAGVAYVVDAPGLPPLRAALAERWRPWLTRQDAGAFQAHVTVQNKVPAPTARALLAALERDFAPWPAQVQALGLWHYRGGPWEAVERVALSG